MGRAPCCDKANVKKGPWSPEEDAKLKSYMEQHGTGGNWIALPQKIGLKRCGKSCRLRWLNYLRPNIKHGDFSEEEDRLICSLYVNIGSRWSIIAAQLPGRTDNDIKNYWNTRLKKKLFGKHHERQQQMVRRGRKIKTDIGNSMAIVFDDHLYNQSPYLPELSSVLNSPAPYTNYQDAAVPCYDINHHESIRNSLTKLVGGRFSDQSLQLIPSQFPSNTQQIYSHAGDDLCRTDATQFAVDGAGLPIPQGQSCHVVGELENLVYNNTPAFDDGLQFLYVEDDTKNESNGMIDDCDWGEMSSLISAPLYPSATHELIGSSYLDQQKQ